MKIEKKHVDTFFVVSYAWQLGLYVVVPIIGMLFLGKSLDNFLKTSPVFLILGVTIGFIVSMYEIFHFTRVLIKK